MKRTKFWWNCRFWGSFWLCLAPLLGSRAVGAAVPGKEEVRRALEVMPRGFVPNQGQWDERAAFAAVGFYGTTWVTRGGELRHVLLSRGACEEKGDRGVGRFEADRGERRPCRARAWVLSERFVGGKVRGLRGRDELVGRVSFFIGNDPRKHRSGLSTYRYLELGEVVPGVRVTLAAGQKTVEKVFEVLPGADPGRIWIELEGAQGVRLREAGELAVATGYGEVVFSAPVAWQEEGGVRTPVAVAYRLAAGGKRYGFALGSYDPTRPVWIDPILQSTYLGGSGGDGGLALAIHPTTGEVYVAGNTYSTDFPNTAGGAQASNAGEPDAFVARLNANLTQNPQSTYLGGSGDDAALALAIHPTTGEVVLAGYTTSTDFPNTTGGAQASNAGEPDAFVARLNANLTQNPQSTYLGGSGDDYGFALAIHPATGEVYVAGHTWSANFPNTAGGAQPSNGGNDDAFVARLNANLTANPQSTYLGGSGGDGGYALAIHPTSGEVYVAGDTNSTDFPNTAGGAQASSGGSLDAFVARLNANLTQNPQSTYLGGSGFDGGYALAIHPTTGEVIVAGNTTSTDFPNTTGGAQAANAGLPDAFVARLNANLTQNPQSTYLGGSFAEYRSALAIHPTTGEVYVAGFTYSDDFPNTTGGAQAAYAGGADAFVARLNANLTANPQSTYLGGSGYDVGSALAIHPTSGEVVVAGWTSSTDFPNTTVGAQAANAGLSDAFVARLTSGLAASASADMVANAGSVPPSLGPGGVYNLSFSCTNAGPDPAANATCGVSVSAGSVSGLSCSPLVPVASLPSGSTISCTYTFTAPGSQGGGNTAETGVTFTFTAGSATTDPNTANNTATSGATPIPLVDALDDAASFPASTAGATFNVGANDQYGSGSLPSGSPSPSFSLVSGSTTCTGSSINATTGVATFNVPASGTCVVAYRVCVVSGCDTAQLVVTAQQVEAIPTLEEWGLVTLITLLAASGVLLLRRLWA